MTPVSDPIEQAIVEGARRALTKRAAKLREEAAGMATTTTDRDGRTVPVVSPEARIKVGIADTLDEAAEAIAPPP